MNKVNLKKLLFGLTIVSVAYTTACAQTPNTSSGSCKQLAQSTVCVDNTPCKVINGLNVCLSTVSLPAGSVSVGKTCWSYSTSYSCLDNASVDTCTPSSWWNGQTCSQVGSTCANTVPETGACSSYSLTFSCLDQAQQSEQRLVCGTGAFNSSSFTTPSNPNSTFAKSAVASEIARQTQVYANCDPTNPDSCLNTPLFAGVQESCTKGFFGLKNCCNAMPGGQSNSQAMSIGMGVAASAVKYAGQKAVDLASPYVFDAMYSGGQYSAGIANSALGLSNIVPASDGAGQFISGGTSFASNGVSAYGFTYGASSATAGGGFMGGNIILGGSTAGGEFTTVVAGSAEAEAGATAAASDFLMFNPYTFAAAIALQYAIGELQKALACTQEEQLLGMHKGSDLSVFTGETCVQKIPLIGTCIQYQDTYCSFNSVLAKLINQQGKAILGLPFNNCTGLTVAQITSLDFTKIDLSEFTNQMVSQAQTNLPTNITGNYQPIMQKQSKGSAQSSQSGTAYPTGF